jgi:hypothetical protein
MAHYRTVVLSVNVMKINKIPFLVTIRRAIKFGTVAWLKNAKADTILANLTKVRNVYITRGSLLEIVKADGQFEPICGELTELGITLNKCSREEHVPVAERRIRTLKERCGCIWNALPFTKLPGMLIVMVSTCDCWLNIFPPKDGISQKINPRELIAGVKIDYNKHIQAEFGEYVQVHEEHNNTMQTRTTSAIATKPTGNAQGGHWFFYSLPTGRMLDRRQWTPLPMPADVIERINVLGKASQVGLNFTNMRNEVYKHEDYDDDFDDDSDYDSNDESSNGDDDDYDDFIAGVDIQNNPDPPDPPDEDADETPNNEDNDGEDESENDDDESENNDDESENNDESDNNADDAPIVPTNLENLTDHKGTLPPVI